MTPCNHWTDRKRCDETATVLMFAPDGEAVPGGYYCRLHATAAVNEYREKLGEVWTLQELESTQQLGLL